MPRPYIKCPLSAALAAKNFGFKFVDGHTECLRLHSEWMSVYDLSMVISHVPGWGKFYIHNESLPLLQPVVGDLFYVGRKEFPYHEVVYDDDRRADRETPFKRIFTANSWYRNPNIDFWIILRNGLPFPKVQYEES